MADETAMDRVVRAYKMMLDFHQSRTLLLGNHLKPPQNHLTQLIFQAIISVEPAMGLVDRAYKIMLDFYQSQTLL